MIIVKKGQGCGNQPLISGTIGKREDGTRKNLVDVEGILCALFCGENKDEILKNDPDMTEQDFCDALTYSMYAVSQFDNKTDLAWDKNSPENQYNN